MTSTIVSAIKRHTQLVNVTRRNGTQTITDGIRLPGTEAVQVNFYSQPMNGKELNTLPEGQRTQDPRNFWALEEIKIEDTVTWAALDYSITNVEYWPEGVFWSGVMVRVGETVGGL